MESITTTEAGADLAAVIARAQKAPVTLTDADREVAIVLSPSAYADYREIQRRESAGRIMALCRETSGYARAQGLTPELLEKLLADDSAE